MNPVVSIVVPTYNEADVLPRAINSALSQTFEGFEVIIVDDSSTDATPRILNKYTDSRIRTCRHTKNKGGAAARNTGIKKAKGEYIAFLDADDEWMDDKLERQMKFMRSLDDEYVASYCDADVRIGPLWDKIRKLQHEITSRPISGMEGGEELIDEVLKINFSIGGSSTLLIEKQAIEKIDGFDEIFQRHQDLELLIRILRQGKLGFLDEILVVKYDTGRPSANIAKEARYQFLRKFSEDVMRLELEGKNIISQHLFNLSLIYFSEGKFKEGLDIVTERSLINQRNVTRLSWSIINGLFAILDRKE